MSLVSVILASCGNDISAYVLIANILHHGSNLSEREQVAKLLPCALEPAVRAAHLSTACALFFLGCPCPVRGSTSLF